MKGFDTLHIKSAVKARNRIPLSNTHVTTGDFGQLLVLKNFETIPGGEYPLSADYFCRTAPLVRPTFGKFNFKVVNAYVPYHQVAFDADAFMDGSLIFEGSTPVLRHITGFNLFSFMNGNCFTSTGATAANAQLIYTASDGSTAYRVMTDKGRYWLKILNQLGYAVPQQVDLQANSLWRTGFGAKKFSMLPLLCFFKLYNDYLSQSQNYNNSLLSSYLQAIKYNKAIPNTGYNPQTGALDAGILAAMFGELRLQYENDYFTSAWLDPNRPLLGNAMVNTIRVPDSQDPAVTDFEQITAGAGDTRLQSKHSTSIFPTEWTQRAADFLRGFDNWTRRNNFSGSREVQRMYSRFGIKSDDFRSHYANVFSVETLPIQVGDVTATADSTGVPLGDYAGKAIMNGSKGFSFKASDRGHVFVLGFFTVVPMNAYGFDRQVLRSQPFDFYTPEFDGLGADAISVGEFFASPIGSGSMKDTDVFGFTERYNDYRYWRDQITGDMRDFNPNADANTWHTGRNLEAVRAAGHLVAQAPDVNSMVGVGSEYNRIFSVTSGMVDHFYLTCRFTCDAILPIMNLNQVANLGEGDTVVPRNGNVIA